ncbi:putative Transcriptional regulator, LysR family [Vibrio nigripulchritudo MADA3029]|uniref:LysR family transcriptional regulator n=1 Tax=Vibrio nigripulchritudo TaxID=28173 RepID=UPI0003B1A6AC|nr:LysR family transcriptional regulator [Vibrio nigripulchritudo]KJY76308.1 LysR family transcriptional regulator [Vibrio nigripulchritudo]CCN50067.1 putative Transcriptional regulator, LysR family [Vibrio nigripulchritudo MADA3020]CCN54343.1 putative Transcriptional regulator, LysR family [Vibrio nigripulchritudo MADA3021]CCN58941.1 putative Transcriptional regulator, LysR family [Vibrio nigripulchritudo MADA3029]
MDIEALRSFLAFVDTGSFTRAAKQTFKTQSAVSMQMKRLESELGKPLFEKQGRNLNLTKDGQSLALYARQLLQLHDDTLNQIKGQDVETVIRLGCPDDYAESVLPNFVRLLRKEIPSLDLQIVCTPSNRVRMMLDSGRLDIGIVSRPAGSEEGYLLSNDRGVWLIGEDKSLLEQRPIPLVLLQKECQYYASATEGLTKKQIPFKVVASCASAVALTGLIRSGQAIGALAIQNTGEGISILEEDWLPPLPAVDIVLVTSSIARNKFPADLARRLSDKYQTEYS